MNASEPSLRAQNVACRRGDRLLFARLSLALGPGDALHLAGANGIGKSSLMRILCGLLRPYAGKVERDGALALLDERPALDTHLPLGGALAFWGRVDGIAPARLDEVADTVGLGDLMDVPVRYLSTGQRKRAALARTILQGAPIWLLDEPLNGLDTASVAMVERLVAQHCAGGGLCVLASHQPVGVTGLRRLEIAEFAA
ncbi:heme ABC exporter ATP-binding protein CcmA [Croceicoccus ponticola]|uniref:Heme ABC exporter ATP-binding protein CcmA n=1 Tax=Croceicoccus ponticola TaxID=2217664 RepID=A0A437GWC0_9SPHN|nr:heme ABC exporter ATP-binding protein CcmA [Croceicoccus ponticola]RVQ66428.1 heme ABC exporter ATP-binding protein CcmA [Croceicoccus ponticola]